MAFDNFIGWTMAEKIQFLRGVQESRLTGQVVRIQSAHGVFTEFNISQTNITQTLRDIESSIANDEAFDPKDPIQAACAANVRPGVTLQMHR